MNTPAEHLLDGLLERILNRAQHLQKLDLSDEAERKHASTASLELLRTLTQYRGLLKNVGEAM